MATWTRFHYGPDSHQWGESWIPATVNGTGGAVIYFHGSGFEAGWPDAFYDATRGEDFFLEQIEPNEAHATPAWRTCAFSVMVSQNRYQSQRVGTGALTAWNVGMGAVAFGDYVTHGGEEYYCIKGHTAGAGTEPGVGGSWQTVWKVTDPNDINNSGHATEIGAHTPGYRGTGMYDALLAYNYIVSKAATYNFDPTKVVVMGESAGGQKMSPIVWGLPGNRMGFVDPSGANPYRLTVTQRPAGAIFRRTWSKLSQQPDSIFTTVDGWGAKLLGRTLSAGERADFPVSVLDGVSNLGLLEALQRVDVPCYFEYVGEGYHDNGTLTLSGGVFSADNAHHPLQGWQLWTPLIDTYGSTGNVFLEDSPGGGSNARRYADSTSSSTTISTTGTGVSADMWSWYVSTLGI